MLYCWTALNRYVRSLALLALVVGGSSQCSAAAITWTINGTFTDGGTVTGTFVFDPDLGPIQTITVFNFTVSGGNTAVFFPYNFTPSNSHGTSFASAYPSLFEFSTNSAYTSGEPYTLNIIPVSQLTNAGGSINLNTAASNNCFGCNPYRLFASGTVSSPGLQFYPVNPCRLVDTRGASAGFNGIAPFSGPSIPSGVTLTIPVQSAVEAGTNTTPAPCGTIPSTAQAYSLNVTVVPQAGGVVHYI